MGENSKKRIDADNAFLRTQTQSQIRNRIMSETDTIVQARDANTAKLREQRLQKEALEREIAAAAPPKSNPKKRAKPA